MTGATKKTATRDLSDMVAKGVVARIGKTGRGAHYVVAGKGDIRGQRGHPATQAAQATNGPPTGQRARLATPRDRAAKRR